MSYGRTSASRSLTERRDKPTVDRCCTQGNGQWHEEGASTWLGVPTSSVLTARDLQ